MERVTIEEEYTIEGTSHDYAHNSANIKVKLGRARSKAVGNYIVTMIPEVIDKIIELTPVDSYVRWVWVGREGRRGVGANKYYEVVISFTSVGHYTETKKYAKLSYREYITKLLRE